MAGALPLFPTITCVSSFPLPGQSASARRRRGSPLGSSAENANVDGIPPSLPDLRNHYYLLRHGQSTANVAGIISSARSLAGSDRHGLTLLGIEQSRNSAGQLIDAIARDLAEGDDGNGESPQPSRSTGQVYFVSSPFARAKETAEQCIRGIRRDEGVADRAESLGLTIHDEIHLHDGLMERYFGRLDGMELSTYAYVWPVDMMDPTHTAFDVESVAEVCERGESLSILRVSLANFSNSTLSTDAHDRIDSVRGTILELESRYDGGGNHVVLASHADVLQITQVYAVGLENPGKFSSYRFGNGEVRAMKRSVGSLPEPVPLQPPKRGE